MAHRQLLFIFMKIVFTLRFNKLLFTLAMAFLSTKAIAECDSNADKLIKAYPDHLLACKHNHIIWRDGFRQLYDDGKAKSFQQLISSPDIEDMFAFTYRTDEESYTTQPSVNHDSGRIRNDTFFKRMYGGNKKAVRQQITHIPWMPKSTNKSIAVTTVNGVDKKLQRISTALDALPEHLKKYVVKLAGTYNWRVISGTTRLSAHSFGIAIDINTKYANYWKWSKDYRYQNKIPKEIIKIFEDNGFIWGGKWFHYDTMHFEYRPELLL